ncbi:MAG: LLM class flavin-dependent oxidoreductase [Actinomycetota bacterium]
MSQEASYGLLLNMGGNLGDRAEDVMRITLHQATEAERLGLHDLWITEHHFIPFGINPSAVTTAGFLLGRTERIRVGTAVALAPLYHPVELAEHAALLDQLSGGRFDLGIGRGGYLKDYEVLDVSIDRWTEEPLRSAAEILGLWADPNVARDTHTTGASVLQPTPRSEKPPLFIATRSADGIAFAAEHRLPLQHYFAVPVDARVQLQEAYRDAAGAADDVGHLHTLIAVVDDDEEGTRALLAERLTELFAGGAWPHVPGAADARGRTGGHHGPGTDRSAMARGVADGAIVGPRDVVYDRIAEFREKTGARRMAFFVEAIGDERRIQATLDAIGELARSEPAIS